MVIEVPRLKDVPTDVTPNLQDRLNCVTDVLSRVSKLVCEDLDKAVSSAVGQDKDGNPSVGEEGSRFPAAGLCLDVLQLLSAPQVLLKTRGPSWLWFPVLLPRATPARRRASTPVRQLHCSRAAKLKYTVG